MENDQFAGLRIDYVPQTLREIAIERIRAAIVSGQFPSGHRLVERTLVDQLGVSRSVIREAIRYLEAEGLVEILPRSGPVVAMLDWDKARQIYDIRLRLEAAAAADCARLADDAARAHRMHHGRHVLTQAKKDRFELPPRAVSEKIALALETPDPRPRYYVTTPTYLPGIGRRLLSTRALDWFARRS